MKRSIMVLIIAMFISGISSAQYTRSIGARMGKFATGIDMKHFFNANSNVGMEMFLGYTREAKGGYQGRTLIIQQLPIFDSKLQIPVDIIWGAGVNVGYFKENYYAIRDGNAVYYNPKTLAAGVCGMLGLEFDTRRFPITFGIEAIPFYNLYHPGPEWIDVGVSLKVKIQ
jgi:hypothetical protein